MNFFAKIKYYLMTNAVQRAQNNIVLDELELKCFKAGRDMAQAYGALRSVTDGMSQAEVLRKACIVYLAYSTDMFGGCSLSKCTPMLVRENHCPYFSEGSKRCSQTDCDFYEKNIAYFVAKERYSTAVAARDAFLLHAQGHGKNKYGVKYWVQKHANVK